MACPWSVHLGPVPCCPFILLCAKLHLPGSLANQHPVGPQSRSEVRGQELGYFTPTPLMLWWHLGQSHQVLETAPRPPTLSKSPAWLWCWCPTLILAPVFCVIPSSLVPLVPEVVTLAGALSHSGLSALPTPSDEFPVLSSLR